MLVELSVMEQRYQAVMAVIQDGWKISEVAEHLGVARQSVHNWIARYEAGGLRVLPANRPGILYGDVESINRDGTACSFASIKGILKRDPVSACTRSLDVLWL